MNSIFSSLDLHTIHWPAAAVSVGSTANLPDIWSGFYAISAVDKQGSNKLLYIGMAAKQSVKVRVEQEHDAFSSIDELVKQHSPSEIRINSGILASSGGVEPSEDLFRDIECALIYDNQPALNKTCREKYNGRKILIHNEVCFEPLKARTFLLG